MKNNIEIFENIFNQKPEFEYVAPARINIIGEHIDYNYGLVLPCAISKYMHAYVSLRDDMKIKVASKSFEETFEADMTNLKYDKALSFANFPFGSIWVLRQITDKINKGLNIYYDSNIPLSSGISSSAAILDVTIYAINDIFKLGLSLDEITLNAQKVENNYMGLKSGIMDEAAIALGKKDKAILLDCNEFKYDYIDLKLKDYRFAVMATNKKRNLTDSKYNERVDECTKALSIIKNRFGIKNLVDLDPKDLEEVKTLLNDDVLYRRVKHVVTEQNRVKEMVGALNKGDIDKIASLLDASDLSLKDDYEVTGENLDTITELARHYGAVGARMTGAGFGGCAIALLNKEIFDEFSKNVTRDYEKKFGYKPDIFLVDVVDGVKNGK